ncbi:sensor histidine kinase [Streptomyces olivaceoviridis]|uniref:sensor histidine kinase n=1 Tax=Streptomyces olivaceoviridis TaxID=1921 RepID=UPI003695FA20
MTEIRQAWRAHPRLVDLAVAAAGAGLTLLVARARQEGLTVYPQFAGGALEGALNRSLPFAWESVTQGSVVPLLACAALALRRRHPVALTLVLVLLSAGWPLAAPVLVCLFTVANTCSARITGWVTAAVLVPLAFHMALTPYPGPRGLATVISTVTLVAGTVGWGLAVAGLRDRALRAEAEAVTHARLAQQRAREEVAREMHDVLAHRLSLLSMHAGALEYNRDMLPEQLADALGVIRSSANQALEDLQDVLRVLRAPTVGDHTEPPQPTLSEVPHLVEETRAAGVELRLRRRLDEPHTMSPSVGRTAYRLLQEALTNHRKHAPGTPVDVTLTGDARAGVAIAVTNPLPVDPARPAPGSGQGLIGMAERVDLVGGRLHHRKTPTEFRLEIWLPWTT